MKDRSRPLSFRQAANCETAREPVCKCRCGGALHGAARGTGDQMELRGFYEKLHDDDPHHIPSDKDRKELKRLRGLVASLRMWKARTGRGPYATWSARDERDLETNEKKMEHLEVIVLGIHPPPKAHA